MVILSAIHPKLMARLGIKTTNPEVEDFFTTLTREAVKNKAINQDKRKDLLQLLLNVQLEEQKRMQEQNDESEPVLTEHILASNIFLFYLAGLETSATILTYCLYELALNPDITERFYEEIQRMKKTYGEKLDYDAFKEMPYMECIISETLRKHPPDGWMDRSCDRTYQVPNSSLIIKQGMSVLIPTYALHRDPQYFPDPEKFDPERFNKENISKIIPGSYLPFGDGPRMCIGMRFAQLEIKAALIKIIGNYTVHPTEKTEIPIQLDTSSFLNVPRKIYLRFQKRV